MKNTDKAVTGGGKVPRVDRVKIEWLNDNDADLSWLDQSDAEMGEGFEAQSKERKESYGQSWEMLGCVAKAEVSYPCGSNGERRIEWLSSGGLWGIESDMDDNTRQEYEDEQLQDLAGHLAHFGIKTSVKALREIAD
jgi:hypothetical protein